MWKYLGCGPFRSHKKTGELNEHVQNHIQFLSILATILAHILCMFYPHEVDTARILCLIFLLGVESDRKPARTHDMASVQVDPRCFPGMRCN